VRKKNAVPTYDSNVFFVLLQNEMARRDTSSVLGDMKLTLPHRCATVLRAAMIDLSSNGQ
jgi:hypothetical protein